MEKLATIQTQVELSDPAFRRNPNQWFQSQLATWSAEQSISYQSFKPPRWPLLERKLPVRPGAMKSINNRKLHIELYESCRSIIMKFIAEARVWYTMPFLVLYPNLIKSKTSNKNSWRCESALIPWPESIPDIIFLYAYLRLQWVNAKMTVFHYNKGMGCRYLWQIRNRYRAWCAYQRYWIGIGCQTHIRCPHERLVGMMHFSFVSLGTDRCVWNINWPSEE